jgi:hypothetical protein
MDIQYRIDFESVYIMSRLLGAMVDKVRSDMVDYYLGSWFRHKQANAVVILRDGLFTTEQMDLHGMEIRDGGIFLRFGPAVVADKGESAVRQSGSSATVSREKAKPEEVSTYDLTEDEDEIVFRESRPMRGACRRPANWRSAYSLDTVYAETDNGIEMKTFSRSNSVHETNV